MSYASHSIIRSAAAELGVELPATYSAAVDEQSRTLERADEFIARGNDALRLVADALAAGKDPLANKSITNALLARSTTGGLRTAVGQARDRIAASSITEHSDAVLSAFAEALKVDAQTLMDAAARLPEHTDILAPVGEAPIRSGLEFALFAAAREANARFGVARNAAGQIFLAARISAARWPSVIIAAASNDQYNAAADSNGSRHPEAWHFARTGLAPSLAVTIADYAERVVRVQADYVENLVAVPPVPDVPFPSDFDLYRGEPD